MGEDESSAIPEESAGSTAGSTLSDLFRSVARRLRRATAEALAPYDITPSQARALGVLRRDGNQIYVQAQDDTRLPVFGEVAAREGTRVTYGIRPEHLDLAGAGDDGFDVDVIVVEPTGADTLVFSRVGGAQICATFQERHSFQPNQKVRLRPHPGCVHLFDAESGVHL